MFKFWYPTLTSDGCLLNLFHLQDPKDAMLRQYQEEIERLKAMLAGQGGAAMPGQMTPGVSQEDTSRALEREKQRLREEKESELQEIERRLKDDYESKYVDFLYADAAWRCTLIASYGW